MENLFNKNKTAFIISAALVFSSCEKIIDYKIPETELFIVVNSIVKNHELLKVNVSKSCFVLDTFVNPFIENAVVEFYENDAFVKNLEYSGNGFYTGETYTLNSDIEYGIKIKVEGKEELFAKCKIPHPVQIDKIDTVTVGGTNIWDQRVMDFIITINDPSDTANYYGLSVTRRIIEPEDSVENLFSELFIAKDRIIELYEDDEIYPFSLSPDMGEIYAKKIYFSDRIVDGKKFSVRVTLPNYTFFGTYSFYLYSISKDYYLYLSSLAQFNNSNGNPFSEPVQVYSNVTNGLGIFGGYSSAKDSVVIEKVR